MNKEILYYDVAIAFIVFTAILLEHLENRYIAFIGGLIVSGGVLALTKFAIYMVEKRTKDKEKK